MTKVQTKFALAMESNALYQAMIGQTAQRVGTMKKQIADAVDARLVEEQKELTDGQEVSKDFANLEAWKDSEPLARLFLSLKINPRAYVLMHTMSADEVAKHGFDPNATTRNLKAYKKTLEIASYIMDGNAKCENVVKAFVACLIQASRIHETVDRDMCENFLRAIDISKVSPDLATAIDEYRAKHMTGGAATQTSQATLTLAALRAVQIVTDGRRKHVRLNKDSLVIEALATRFGLEASLTQ